MLQSKQRFWIWSESYPGENILILLICRHLVLWSGELPLKQSFYVVHAYQICRAIRRTFLTAMQIPVFWRKNRFRKIFCEFQFRIHILQILKNKEQQKKGSYHVHFKNCDTDFSIFFCLSNYIHFIRYCSSSLFSKLNLLALEQSRKVRRILFRNRTSR